MSDSASNRGRREGLADALLTKTQQRLLGLLFGQPDRSFYASELIRQAGTGSGAAQRELARLETAGLITGRRVGRQKHYQANPKASLFSELRGIITKTVGVAEPIRTALKPVSRLIRAAFVYGSVAKGTDRAESDIDLLVVSDSLTYADLFGALESAGRRLGRKINVTLYSPEELTKRARAKNSFVTRVLAQPKMWIMGGEHDLSA